MRYIRSAFFGCFRQSRKTVTNRTRGQGRVARVMISKYERGEAIPSIDAAKKNC